MLPIVEYFAITLVVAFPLLERKTVIVANTAIATFVIEYFAIVEGFARKIKVIDRLNEEITFITNIASSLTTFITMRE